MQANLSEKRKKVVAVARECLSVALNVEKRDGDMEGGRVYEWII